MICYLKFVIYSIHMPLPTLQEVDDYPVPDLLIPRLVRVYGYSQEMAEGLVREAKRMLYLHHCTKEIVNPSLKVDDAWHEMLMFTRFYQEFCDFIGGFVHHMPTPPPGSPEEKKATEEAKKRAAAISGPGPYKKTKMMYEEEFGEAVDSVYWP